MSSAKRKYKPYPKYKDSGVEWLGRVPEHWDVKRLRYCTQLNPSPADLSPDLEVSFLPMEAIGEDGSLKLDQTRIVKETGASYTYFADNDVAYAKVTPCLENGKGALMRGLTNGHGFGTSEITILRPISIDGRFLDFIRRSHCFVGPATSVMLGAGGLKRVPDLFARDYYSPYPPPTEQTAIADFIEHECGRMDKLVEKKQEFIALLKEKRQALITHAVTKGLDPKAAMKDSGVEWLGKVPKHWDVKRLRYCAEINPSSNSAELDPTLEVSFLPMEAIGETGQLDLSQKKEVSEIGSGYTYFANGDITFAKVTPCFENGKGALMDGLTNGHGFGTSELTVLRPTGINPHYLNYVRLSSCFKGPATSVMLGAGGLKRVPDLFVRDYYAPFPPPEEQIAIADHIDRETTRIDHLIAKTIESIDLLKERKTSLITAAVTGQIDVSQSA